MNLRWMGAPRFAGVAKNEGGYDMADATGGCLCGRVRYTLTGDPAVLRPVPLPQLPALYRIELRGCRGVSGERGLRAGRAEDVSRTLEIPENRCSGGSVRTAAPACWRKQRSCRASSWCLSARWTTRRHFSRPWRSFATALSRGSTEAANGNGLLRCLGDPATLDRAVMRREPSP